MTQKNLILYKEKVNILHFIFFIFIRFSGGKNMYNDIEEIKAELKQLCTDYVDILDRMKQEKIISQEVYNECTSKKIFFLDEQ